MARSTLPGRRPTSAGYTPYLVLAISLVATAVASFDAEGVVQRQDDARFRHDVDMAIDAIKSRASEQVTLLRGTAAFVAAQPQVDRQSFRTYVQTLNLAKNYPGVLGIGFDRKLDPSQIGAVEKQMAAQGMKGFKVHPLPAGLEPHAILYLEPENLNAPAFGYNMFSDPVRRQAMDKARDSGMASISGKVVLVQEPASSASPGFLAYRGVYAGGTHRRTLAERRRDIVGFVYSPFRALDFFKEVLTRDQFIDLRFEIFDGQSTDPKEELYSGPESDRVGSLVAIDYIQVPGHIWTLRTRSLPGFVSTSSTPLATGVTFLGGVVSLLLFGITLSQGHARSAAMRYAERLSRISFSDRLLADAGSVLGSSIDTQRTLAEVAQLAVPGFADWCAVDVMGEDGEPSRVAVAHVDPERIEQAKEVASNLGPERQEHMGIRNVLRTGVSELYPSITDEMLDRAGLDESRRAAIKALQINSVMVVPMKVRERILGAITFVWAESGKHYSEADLELAEQIASRAAVAIENSHLYGSAQAEISQRRRAEFEIRSLNASLERKVEERTRDLKSMNNELEAFCYSVSHDLRAPLRSIDGFSQAVLEDSRDVLDSAAVEYLARVRAAAHRMDELITALLTLSRLTRAEVVRNRIDVTRMVHDLTEDHHGSLAAVLFNIQPNMVTIADPRLLRIVLDNLLSNAIKFSSKVDHPTIEVGCTPEGTFFVRDNGVGFNPEYSSKLFTPFERLHSSSEYPGSGIGLATVQRIISRHGGHIWADSAEAEGATFYFTLDSGAESSPSE